MWFLKRIIILLFLIKFSSLIGIAQFTPVKSFKLIEFEQQYGVILDIKFTPDSQFLVFGTTKGLFFFDTIDYLLKKSIVKDKGIKFFKFSDSGKLVFLCLSESKNTYEIYDLGKDKSISTINDSIIWFTYDVVTPEPKTMRYSNSFAFVNNDYIIYISSNNMIKVHNIEKDLCKEYLSLQDGIVSIGYSKSMNMYWAGCLNKNIYFVDIINPQIVKNVKLDTKPEYETLRPYNFIDESNLIYVQQGIIITTTAIDLVGISFDLYNMSGKFVSNLYSTGYNFMDLKEEEASKHIVNTHGDIFLLGEYFDQNDYHFTPVSVINGEKKTNSSFTWLDYTKMREIPLFFYVDPISNDGRYVIALKEYLTDTRTPDLYIEIWKGKDVFGQTAKIDDFKKY